MDLLKLLYNLLNYVSIMQNFYINYDLVHECFQTFSAQTQSETTQIPNDQNVQNNNFQ